MTALSLALALTAGAGAGCASHHPTAQEQARAAEQKELAARAEQEKKQEQIDRKLQAKADADARKREEERERNFMPDEQDMHTVDEFILTSAQAGARNDAMIFSNHFDGTHLNSAGKTKLFLMLADRKEAPGNVYLDLAPNDPLASARLDSLKDYLQKTGLGGPRVRVIQGENPQVRHAAAEGLQNYHKTDTSFGSSNEQGGYQPVPTQQPGMNPDAK